MVIDNEIYIWKITHNSMVINNKRLTIVDLFKR